MIRQPYQDGKGAQCSLTDAPEDEGDAEAGACLAALPGDIARGHREYDGEGDGSCQGRKILPEVVVVDVWLEHGHVDMSVP